MCVLCLHVRTHVRTFFVLSACKDVGSGKGQFSGKGEGEVLRDGWDGGSL